MTTTKRVQMQKAVGETMPTKAQYKSQPTSQHTVTRHNQNSKWRQLAKLNANNASQLKSLSQQQGL
jgi:hypothetical protein